jgi:hypothetical protein
MPFSCTAVPRLDEIAAAHELTIVAAGRADLCNLFERDAGRSVLRRAYPRADSPDRPPSTGRNYLQPQQIISSQSRKLPADITELPQPLEVCQQGRPLLTVLLSVAFVLGQVFKLAHREYAIVRRSPHRRSRRANLPSDPPVISAGNFLDHQGLCGAFADSYGCPD